MTGLTVEAALAQVARSDGDIRAWVGPVTDPGPTPDGPLHGWPVGIKDLIDVRGLPTGAGAHDGSIPEPAIQDADVVTRLKEAGAAVLGKTAAVEYGWFGTVRTRHPLAADRSPGGSSSGSAAAVAGGMARAALGTQTAGSVIRPAAYTGVPAVKWSHGVVPMAGVIATSPSLDSLGAYAATVDDLIRLSSVVLAAEAAEQVERPPVLLVLDDPAFADVEPGVRRRFVRHVEDLVLRGATVRTFATALPWADLARAHRTIMVRELATVHESRCQEDPGHYSPSLREGIAEGLAVTEAAYRAALETRRDARVRLSAALEGVEAFLTPAATSFAPPAGQPGNPACQIPFTLAGLPAVAVPTAEVAGELPCAVQLVGRHGGDLALLATAAWCASPVPVEA